jgi:hypothetical protein
VDNLVRPYDDWEWEQRDLRQQTKWKAHYRMLDGHVFHDAEMDKRDEEAFRHNHDMIQDRLRFMPHPYSTSHMPCPSYYGSAARDLAAQHHDGTARVGYTRPWRAYRAHRSEPTIAVDKDGDGLADFSFTGADLNRDGIPDQLQDKVVPIKPSRTMDGRLGMFGPAATSINNKSGDSNVHAYNPSFQGRHPGFYGASGSGSFGYFCNPGAPVHRISVLPPESTPYSDSDIIA